MTTQTTQTPSQRLLRLPQLRETTGLGTTKIYELVAEGKFPKPVRLTARSVAWPEAEVAQWVAARIAERDAQPAPDAPQRKKLGRTRSTNRNHGGLSVV